jgi:hypothetical protein
VKAAALSALATVALYAAPTQVDAGVASHREWRFEVLLDDKPIGLHRFQLSTAGETRELLSEANFRVKILGLTVYDYSHQSSERWKNDCLQRIDASTDDNGDDFFVRGKGGDHGLLVESQTGSASLSGCVMTFAYWNPAMLQQQRLLNTQTGEYIRINVERLGEQTLDMRGRAVPALHYRVRAGERDIELWYSSERDWLGLSSTTRGGRQLHYRRLLSVGDAEVNSGG